MRAGRSEAAMSSSGLRWPSSRSSSSFHLLLFTTLALISNVFAISFKPAPTPDLDLSGLGRVALAGDFDSISLYNYVGQKITGLSSNGSQSLLGRYPDGSFTPLQSSDAFIEALCPFVAADGSLNGIIVGGNFTSLGGQQAQAVALFDPAKNTVTPLPGLTGQVYSVYCDNARQTVYFGGMFSGANSTNAIAWTDGWTPLPFAGFNGQVNSVDKLPNGNIVFGGSFTGIGNMTLTKSDHKHDQVINIGAANITVLGQSSNPKYSNVSTIICSTAGKGSDNSFLLQDNSPGSFQADFGFGFMPSKIRLYNSQTAGYATKTWRFTALPINGILNFTYTDSTGTHSCTNECPLAQNAEYQDFEFVNGIGMSGFRVDISAWYGQGAGLSGIELFSNQIFSFAINDFNEPKCDHLPSGASSTTSGDWSVAPAGSSYSNYLRADLPNGTGSDDEDSGTSVVFKPNIEQSGNYSIFVYTPGCVDDGSCASRGVVNITGQLSSAYDPTLASLSAQIYQTNYYLKYDQVFSGYIEATSDSFQPTVTLTPSPNQQRYLTVVAQSIKFELISSQDGLNGLFEYNPNKLNVGSNYDKSAVNKAGSNLNEGAQIIALAHDDDSVTYAAGSFSSQSVSNILSISNGKSSSLAHGGLDDVVQALYYTDGALFVAGNFTTTSDKSVQNLNNVAWYDVSSNTWHPLGAGVNGMAYSIVPLTVNITGHGTQQAVAVSGYFDQINAFGSHNAISVDSVAVWVLSKKNWLQIVDPDAVALSGQLNAYTTVPDQAPIWSGGVTSQMLQAGGIVQLTDSQGLNLEALPIDTTIEEGSGQMQKKLKRASVVEPDSNGIVTGMYYTKNNLNLTILAGHFSAQASNGKTVSNLVFVDGSNKNKVTGLESTDDSDAAVYALDTQDELLIAGGSINGGVLLYDLSSGKRPRPPPGLNGRDGIVYAVATRPKSTSVFVGGSFSSAGSLSCPGLCVYDTKLQQWNTPGTGLAPSSIVHILQWVPDGQLLVAGSLKVKGKQTTMAMYDPKKAQYTEVSNANQLPGPISAYTPVFSSFSSAFVAGVASSNNSAYIAYFDGDDTWTPITGLGKASRVQGLQVLSVNSDHDDSNTVNSDQVLLVTGKLQLQGHGMVSAATYDGSKFTPFALSTLADGSPGSISHVFVENMRNLLTTQESNLALGFIVLIGLACALGAVFLIVVLGILAERLRRRQEGYVPAPSGPLIYEKSGGGKVGKIAPEQIFGGVGPGKGTSGSRL